MLHPVIAFMNTENFLVTRSADLVNYLIPWTSSSAHSIGKDGYPSQPRSMYLMTK